MDAARAARMQGELINTTIGGWELREFLGAGKSALVFGATKDDLDGALKVFDPELVQRFGTDVQAARIERELRLRDKSHPNLVKIFDGGQCKDTNLFFIVMERLSGQPLSAHISDIPRELIWPLISQIASAARYLEDLHLVHRDIKPDNVIVSADFSHACLMDFGVIRPIGEPGLTDGDERPFIGTLQYSSPEFLFRTEDDTPDGWRALTFYQLGAVLHDLIMKQRIFSANTSPYAALVEAVKSLQPIIEAPDVPEDLVLLARSCLNKDPALRLKLVEWEQFDPVPPKRSSLSTTEERIRKRQLLARGATAHDTATQDRAAQTLLRTLDYIEERIQGLVRNAYVGNELFPPAQMLEWRAAEPKETYFVVRFDPSEEYSLPHCLQVWFSVRLLDATSTVIQVVGDASASSAPLETKPFDATGQVDLFEGTLDESVLEPRLRSFLYIALDQAQSTTVSELRPVVWLSCVEETSA